MCASGPAGVGRFLKTFRCGFGSKIEQSGQELEVHMSIPSPCDNQPSYYGPHPRSARSAEAPMLISLKTSRIITRLES
jgi:hypothetical protein